MALTTGTRLGPYEITSQLGAGGMGEVYRARDSRLDREVAIKVLPAEFARDKDRLYRFEQEARAAGMLNHPNILIVHDIGTHEGSPYIVSELLEGETLRAQLKNGTLPVRKAVDYATQVARGLAAAHEKRIVHRDLKPENLFITTDGRVKILDFGLAKLRAQQASDDPRTESMSTLEPGTEPGTVMGTVGYMSPEQVRGREADHRTDIFSFGAILYEMLSGRRAFRGNSVVETLNAILKEEPRELAEENRTLAPGVERVVRHCLEKSPGQRFQSAIDLAFALEALSGLSTAATTLATRGTRAEEEARMVNRRRGRERTAWVVAAIFFLVALVLTAGYFERAPVEMRAIRFFLSPLENTTGAGCPTISPDGRLLAFVATSEGKTLLWVRPLDSLAAHALPGTEGANQPFWSHNSRFIAFFAQGKLKKVNVSSGAPLIVCDAADGRSGTWNRDGVMVFQPGVGGFYRVAEAGGMPTPVTTPDQSRREITHRWPHFLPDGRHFVYNVRSAEPENGGIYLGSLDSRETKRLLIAVSSVAYAPPGYLLFVHEGTLMAQPFDAHRLQITGEAFSLVEGVAQLWNTAQAYFSVSENGVLAYLTSGATGTTQLIWFNREGKKLGSIGAPSAYHNLALSPDEKRVALEILDPQKGAADIWLLDVSRGTPSRFTFGPLRSVSPVWSPDGSRIVFTSLAGGSGGLYQKQSSGAGQGELLIRISVGTAPTDWSSDGRFIVYHTVGAKTAVDLWVLPLFGDPKPVPFLQTASNEVEGHLSPNGQWMAYTSDESGLWEVYVQPFPPSGGKWLISTKGGSRPIWRRDGKKLFYIAPDNKLMEVDVGTDSSPFHAGVPRALFDTRIAGSLSRFSSHTNYAVAKDGQRFLINSIVEDTAPPPITVVLNWTAELKR